jgi:hypothetical protein
MIIDNNGRSELTVREHNGRISDIMTGPVKIPKDFAIEDVCRRFSLSSIMGKSRIWLSP